MALSTRDRSALERIDTQYGKADALAVYFQRRSDQLFAFLNLVALSMGLAYLVYDKFFRTRLLLLVYLLILVSSVGLYYVLAKSTALVREAPDVPGTRGNAAREVLSQTRER